MTVLAVAGAFIVGGCIGAVGMAVFAAGSRPTERIRFLFDLDGRDAVFVDTVDMNDRGVGVGEWTHGADGYWALTVEVAEWEVRR